MPRTQAQTDLELTVEMPVPAAVRDQVVSRAVESLPRAPIVLMGIPFDHLTLPEAIQRIEGMIRSGQPHYIATANVDFLAQSEKDVELRRILQQADLVLCDGTPLLWASRWLGNPLPERVAGADLVPALIRRAAQEGHRIFFLGGQPGVADAAVRRLREQHPKLVIAGHYSPPFRPLLEMDHREIRRQLRAARPDLLFISFGCPKAEKWMAMHCRTLGVPVSIGVGATIDFLAGRVKRAPRWMQRAGVEWLYRLAQEPGRLGPRYAMDLRHFATKLLRQKLGLNTHPSAGPIDPLQWTRLDGGVHLVQPPPVLTRETVERDALTWAEVVSADCVINMAGVRTVDSTGVGLLLQVQKRLEARQRQMVLLMPSPEVRRALNLLHLDNVFLSAHDTTEARWRIAAREAQLAGQIMPAGATASTPWVWRGELTAANAARVWRNVRPALKDAVITRKRPVVDISGLKHLDSSGVRVLLRARALAEAHHSQCDFVKWPDALADVVRRAGAERQLLASS